MRVISEKEIADVQGAGLVGTVLGRVDHLGTTLGGTVVTTTLALNDAVFSIVQVEQNSLSLEPSQLGVLI